MARFQEELPNDLIKEIEGLHKNCEAMFMEMTEEGAKVVYKNVKKNMKNSFKDTSRLEECLKITRTYKTPSDDGINTKIGFYGYLKGTEGKKLSYTKRGKKYTYYNGIPAPLVAIAREYGTKSGEPKKPFFRKSFRKSEIEAEMKKVQEKYLPKE